MVVQTVVTFAAGMVFGLALAAPPGPMNAIIAEESVVRGWTASASPNTIPAANVTTVWTTTPAVRFFP